MFTIKDVLVSTKGRLLSGKEEDILRGISIDTRRIKGGELFLAIKGQRFDGHNFILDAISKDAGGVLVQDGCIVNSKFKMGDVSFVSVPDSIKALGDLANFHRGRFKIPLIGITGSNGKTTTKEMTAAILAKKLNVLKNFGTENNQIGVPLTLMRLKPEHNIGVLEMGTNRLGEVRRLSEIARPSVALITNIGPSHLEHLKDTDTVLKAKCEILEFLDKDAKVVINADDELLEKLKIKQKVVKFGMDKSYDFYADKVDLEPDGIKFRLNGKHEIEMSVVGRHNVYNALAAIAASWDFGVSIDEIKEALRDFRVPNMRMEVKRLGDIRIINDSYNSNPLSMRKAIEALKDMTTKGRKILVAGDMLELGNLSGRFHHLVGRQAAESGIDVIVAVGKLAEHVANGAQEAGMSQKKIKMCNLTKDACEAMLSLVKKGDTVLVKGSRAMKMETIVEGLETQFK
ncbi:MAG: UDP-N-acetylmuramoyl-tripeptide--D-alanyl-D-alanine ligase [Candidatus Omnitrophica bacterium]|nr:UDP-N-acetylmuramoyl-tripeptide--D-alanyl-D-alanine ligase [Candidatus Omnitrophota bacterium]MBU4590306.1 UDP-N-acetylmuramoyl-tripeptide--D-alanyl-D-alanine ligase [Candidatus Omnitrophota bacterium]